MIPFNIFSALLQFFCITEIFFTFVLEQEEFP